MCELLRTLLAEFFKVFKSFYSHIGLWRLRY